MADNNEQQNRHTADELNINMTTSEFMNWIRRQLEKNLSQAEIEETAAAPAADQDAEPIKKSIRVAASNDPRLNPDAPEFDPELWLSMEERGGTQEVVQSVSERLKGMFAQRMDKETIDFALNAMTEALNSIVNTLFEIIPMNAMASMLETLKDTDFDDIIALEPYLLKELERPEYGGRDLLDLYRESATLTGEELQRSLYTQALLNAKAAMVAAGDNKPKLTVNGKISSLEYPLDKVNANIWALLTTADKTGQLTFATERRGSKKEADVIYSINFDELEQETGVTITKKLTAFDKRVYIAASALFNGGNDIATVAQIYAAMGNSGRPNANDIKKINDSLTKMAAAHIYLNNEKETRVYPKYKKFVYDASLLPMERISAIVNGQTTDTAIHFFREPPLVSFAKERRQITTVSRQLLESPLSKTDANLQLDDYLIERISHIKKSKGSISNKLLYTKIFEKTGVTTKMQRSRAKEKISQYLEHYKKCGFIKNYNEGADGISVYF